MPQTRKKVRDAATAILGNDFTGFNARLESLIAEYNLPKDFRVDWDNNSVTFFQGYIDASQADGSQIASWPAVFVYTSNLVNENRQKPRTFSGTITLHIDVWLRFRDGVEQDDIESVCDAVEDAAISALYDDAAGWPPSVTPAAEYSVSKEPAQLMGDGWQQRIPIVIPVEVDA